MQSKDIAVLYRVEHLKTGAGPWRDGNTYHNIDLSDVGNEIPLPHNEAWKVVQDLKVPARGSLTWYGATSKVDPDHRCAFPSLEVLKRYFHNDVINDLKRYGFGVVEIHTDKFAIGEHQAIFDKTAVKCKRHITKKALGVKADFNEVKHFYCVAVA